MAEKNSCWDVGAQMTTQWSTEAWGDPPALEEVRPFFVADRDTGVDLRCCHREKLSGYWWSVSFEIVGRAG